MRTSGLIYSPKLNWEEVNDIRRSYVINSRVSGLQALARRYDVSPNTIHKIVHGKVWKTSEGDGNVPPPLENKYTSRMFSLALGRMGREIQALRDELQKLNQFD